MRSRDALYRALRAQRGSWYETQILRGPAVYGDNVAEPYAKGIHSLELELALFDDDGPQIGIARAAKCRMEIEETKDNWPRGASFIIRTRLHDEACTQASGWMSLGVFFTDQRKPDPFGTLTITAYDGMLLLEQSWTDKAELPSQWPITAAAAAALLEEATGVELENPELLDDTTPFIGLNTTSTAREVWSDIAAALGCNLQMTSEGRLRLIPFAALPDGYRGAASVTAQPRPSCCLQPSPQTAFCWRRNKRRRLSQASFPAPALRTSSFAGQPGGWSNERRTAPLSGIAR